MAIAHPTHAVPLTSHTRQARSNPIHSQSFLESFFCAARDHTEVSMGLLTPCCPGATCSMDALRFFLPQRVIFYDTKAGKNGGWLSSQVAYNSAIKRHACVEICWTYHHISIPRERYWFSGNQVTLTIRHVTYSACRSTGLWPPAVD